MNHMPFELQVMLGLPRQTRACLFDLDGVLTQTAKVHAAAWKQMFDAYLKQRAERKGEEFVPFEPVKEYDDLESFLASRGIEMPQVFPNDPPTAETIDGLGNRKNELVLEMIKREGVQ